MVDQTSLAYQIGQVFGYVFVLVLGAAIGAVVLGKAGFSRWWALLLLIPVVNFVVMAVFAFREWPVQRELRGVRMRRGVQHVVPTAYAPPYPQQEQPQQEQPQQNQQYGQQYGQPYGQQYGQPYGQPSGPSPYAQQLPAEQYPPGLIDPGSFGSGRS